MIAQDSNVVGYRYNSTTSTPTQTAAINMASITDSESDPEQKTKDVAEQIEALGTLQYQFFVDSPDVHEYKYMSPLANAETSIGAGVSTNRQSSVKQDHLSAGQALSFIGKIGQTAKQITDAEGALVTYPLWQILPESVVYANGSQVKFAYDGDGDVAKITEKPGFEWVKDLSNPGAYPQRFKRWGRSDGKAFNLEAIVLPDGNYQMIFDNSDVLTYTTSGKKLLSRPFPKNFDLQQSIVRVFKILDGENSGLIDKGQINRGVSMNWKSTDDAQLVTMLKLHYEIIQITREKSIFKIGKGISKEEITQYDRLTRKIFSKDTSAESLKTITALFDVIDSDNDQNISLDEIALNFEAGKFNPAQTTSLAYIINHSEKLHAFTEKGYVDRTTRMTRSEFTQHYNDVYNDQVTKYQSSGGWGIDQVWQKTMESRRTLYADINHPHESLRIEAIKQGMVGDCLFLAAMASLISVRPGVIMQSIVSNENGTYTVTFMGAPESPIALLPPTSSELALYAKGSAYGIWAPLMEKAYGLLVAKRRNLSSVIPAENTATRENMKSLEIIGGRQTRWEYTQDSASRALGMCKQTMNEKELRNLLINCFAQNRAIIAAALKGAAREKTEPAICGMHAYSVIGFNEKNDIVSIRNPWGIVSTQGTQTELYPIGGGKPIVDDGSEGVFKLPLASFAKKFEGLCIESK
jgi:Ca2+-binding EF-hand superfamily protein